MGSEMCIRDRFGTVKTPLKRLDAELDYSKIKVYHENEILEAIHSAKDLYLSLEIFKSYLKHGPLPTIDQIHSELENSHRA